jgi:putative membrane protein
VTNTRFPRRVYEAGTEPDPRFTMANERTFLAWIRTALALIAGGVALEALGLPLQPALRLGASILLLALGLIAPLLAWRAWSATETALRQNTPLPSSRLALLTAVGVTAVAVLIVLGIFLR